MDALLHWVGWLLVLIGLFAGLLSLVTVTVAGWGVLVGVVILAFRELLLPTLMPNK